MKHLILILAAALSLGACNAKPLSADASGNPNITVEKLFTHDGCTAYRFYDGRTVHYVKCENNTTTQFSYSCGKNCTGHEDINMENTDAQ